MSTRWSEEAWLPKHTISPYQAYALIITNVFGVGVLVFPRFLAKETGTDGILVILLMGILSSFILFVISKLGKLYPGMSFVGICREVLETKEMPWLGKISSGLFLALFVVIWLMGMGMVVRTFGQVMVTAVYQRTPIVVIMLMMVVAATYVSHSRADVLARFNEFLLPFIFSPGILLIAALIQEGRMEYVLPLFQTDWKHLMKGLSTMVFSFTGIELALIFMGAYQHPKKALRPHMTAMFVITVFGYWLTYLVCLAVFGREELTRLAWPMLELMKVVHIPGMILERLESAVLSIWVIAVFTTLTNTMFAITHTLHMFFGLANHHRKWLTLLIGGVIYGMTLFSTNAYELSQWGGMISYMWLFYLLVIPSLLYLIACI